MILVLDVALAPRLLDIFLFILAVPLLLLLLLWCCCCCRCYQLSLHHDSGLSRFVWRLSIRSALSLRLVSDILSFISLSSPFFKRQSMIELRRVALAQPSLSYLSKVMRRCIDAPRRPHHQQHAADRCVKDIFVNDSNGVIIIDS